MATGCCGVKKQKLSASVTVCERRETMEEEEEDGPSAGTRSHFHSNHAILRNGCVKSCVSHPHTPNGFVCTRSNRVVSREMLFFCFDVLYSYLYGCEAPKTPKFPNEQFPLFVTWKVGKERKLRGCIGTFNCTSLHHGLREYAITSACKDSRFEPISPEEFDRLHCSVSLLMDFEMADHYLDWDIGIHGIRIEFHGDKGSKKAATYLPEVAIEQGWNHVQTIDSLLRKGGYKGSITPDIRSTVCVIRFQSDKLTFSYADYVAHRHVNSGPVPSFPSSNGYHKKHQRLFPTLTNGHLHHHRYPTRSL